MDSTILLFLLQDGLTNGAIYALLGLALVLVFAVTRVIFVPQGEFVAYGGLTFALLEAGKLPGTAYMVVAFGAAAFAMEIVSRVARPQPQRHRAGGRLQAGTAAGHPVPRQGRGGGAAGRCRQSPPDHRHRCAHRALSLPRRVPAHRRRLGSGPPHHRRRRPSRHDRHRPRLFRAEGLRAPPISSAVLPSGPIVVTGQSLGIYAITAALIVALYLFFGRTITGKALRATAINRIGARLVGIRTRAFGPHRLHPGGGHRRGLRRADRADDDALLRHRLPHRPQGLRRRHYRRARQLPAHRCRRPSRRHRRGLRLLPCQRLEGGHRLHPAAAGPPHPLVDRPHSDEEE
jgi:branched-chain amino acid transport system permease protein